MAESLSNVQQQLKAGNLIMRARTITVLKTVRAGMGAGMRR